MSMEHDNIKCLVCEIYIYILSISGCSYVYGCLRRNRKYFKIAIYRESWLFFFPNRNNKWIFYNKSKCRINPWCLLVNRNNHNVTHVSKRLDYAWKQLTVLPPDCYTSVEIFYGVLPHLLFILGEFDRYAITCSYFCATVRQDIIY